MENLQIQTDEIEALSSIYGEDWKCENEVNTSFSIEVNQDVKLYIYLDSTYPGESPPTYLLQAPYLSKSEKTNIDQAFSDIFLKQLGNPIIYEWIEKLKDLTLTPKESPACERRFEPSQSPTTNLEQQTVDIVIHHGEQITDRKSKFQGHVCAVNSQEEVKNAMDLLLQNKKIAQATHNILAYRIVQSNNLLLQDCDDDGEFNAGGRLLHLLQLLDVKNVMVVVSRWYGGIHLGPDRFKHINNAARNGLLKAHVIK